MVGLQDRTGHLPSELSGGEQQRVQVVHPSSLILVPLLGHYRMNLIFYSWMNPRVTWIPGTPLRL